MPQHVINTFADRLNEVCTILGIPEGRGRNAALARRFHVTANAARKWLEGVGLPELAKAIEIANQARVTVTWLLQGIEPKFLQQKPTFASVIGEAAAALPAPAGREVADVLRYKIERATELHAAEKCQKYLARIDELLYSRDE